MPRERAVRMPLAIFSAWALPTAPASTVRSWANRYTGRPSMRAKPHTTPSVGCRRSAMPKSVHWVSASMNSSVKLPGSTSLSMRSRAVSLPSPCCLSMARGSPASTRASISASFASGVSASGVDLSGAVVSSAIRVPLCWLAFKWRPSTSRRCAALRSGRTEERDGPSASLGWRGAALRTNGREWRPSTSLGCASLRSARTEERDGPLGFARLARRGAALRTNGRERWRPSTSLGWRLATLRTNGREGWCPSTSLGCASLRSGRTGEGGCRTGGQIFFPST